MKLTEIKNLGKKLNQGEIDKLIKELNKKNEKGAK